VALAARRDEASTRLMTIFRQTGSREAFGLLYRLNAPPILRSLERRLPRQAPGVDPSDVIQDAFLSVLLYPRRFEPRGERAFRVWMRAIVANSVRRRLCRTPRRLSFVDGAALNEVKEDAPGPSDTARDSEEAAGLRRAWWLLLLLYLQAYRALRPREKSRLHLVEIRGLDYATAASRTGETYNNFKMGVFRARRRILRAMERSLSSYRTRTKCTKLEPRRSG
jgi:RNA polymerase sigma factor (sigma-70 family)